MSYMRIDLNSQNVGRTNVAVFFPSQPPTAEAKHGHPGAKPKRVNRLSEGEKYQTLWLLHGSGGNFSHWPLYSMVMEVCERQQLAVIMPTVQDFVDGQPDLGNFFRYVSEELPQKLRNILPISESRDDNFICGLSYGGYLAYRIALTHCETFSHVGSLSSPINVLSDIREKHMNQYGFPSPDEVEGTDRDVLYLVRKAVEQGAELPEMFQACGTEDFTWEYNTSARRAFQALQLNTEWIEFPGIHNFDFWNTALRKFLDWLPLTGCPVYAGREDARQPKV